MFSDRRCKRAGRNDPVGDIIRNDVSIVRSCFVMFVGSFKDGMSKTCINIIAERVSLYDVIAKPQVHRHFGQSITSLS